jgi:hypothetical protein
MVRLTCSPAAPSSVSSTTFARPKSVRKIEPSGACRKFAGLRSRWDHALLVRDLHQLGGAAPAGHTLVERALAQVERLRLVDQVHDQVELHGVDPAPVRRADEALAAGPQPVADPGLAGEAQRQLVGRGAARGRDLQRHPRAHALVARDVHRAHAALGQGALDHVAVGDPGACGHVHGAGGYRLGAASTTEQG